jgi:hypothetical protein
MSRLTETQRAYNGLIRLVEQEIRKRSGPAKDLTRMRETLDVAFYLLGWSQFEYLVREEARELIDERATGHTMDRHAWRHLQDNLKNVPVRRRLDLIFHEKPGVRAGLDRDYELRNDVAHNYKKFPTEARDLSGWLAGLEELAEKF